MLGGASADYDYTLAEIVEVPGEAFAGDMRAGLLAGDIQAGLLAGSIRAELVEMHVEVLGGALADYDYASAGDVKAGLLADDIRAELVEVRIDVLGGASAEVHSQVAVDTRTETVPEVPAEVVAGEAQ